MNPERYCIPWRNGPEHGGTDWRIKELSFEDKTINVMPINNNCLIPILEIRQSFILSVVELQCHEPNTRRKHLIKSGAVTAQTALHVTGSFSSKQF